MKNVLTSFTVFLTLLFLAACTTTSVPEVNEAGWNFCECNSVELVIKDSLAIQTDPKERGILEEQLRITEEACGDFLLKKGAAPKEVEAHIRKKLAECD